MDIQKHLLKVTVSLELLFWKKMFLLSAVYVIMDLRYQICITFNVVAFISIPSFSMHTIHLTQSSLHFSLFSFLDGGFLPLFFVPINRTYIFIDSYSIQNWNLIFAICTPWLGCFHWQSYRIFIFLFSEGISRKHIHFKHTFWLNNLSSKVSTYLWKNYSLFNWHFVLFTHD